MFIFQYLINKCGQVDNEAGLLNRTERWYQLILNLTFFLEKHIFLFTFPRENSELYVFVMRKRLTLFSIIGTRYRDIF